MDYSLPGSSVHGISQARILEWVAIALSRGFYWPRDQTHISCIGREIFFFYHWATKESHYPIAFMKIHNHFSRASGFCTKKNFKVNNHVIEITTPYCPPAISSSVISFSSCLQSFPSSGSFPMSQFFTSGSQSIGVSASTSVLPMSIQDWFPLGWTGWISLQSKELSRIFSNTTVQSINSSLLSFLYSTTLTSIHVYWKNHSFD